MTKAHPNRITATFEGLRARQKKALVLFITAGYPDLKTTEALVPALDTAGADIIELGIPFSDPIADGPTIQASSYQALKKGLTVDKIFKSIKRIRTRTAIPLALMTYYNPVFHYGLERFVARARAADADGLIIPDLPCEEAGDLVTCARAQNLATVFFLSPTTEMRRIDLIAKASRGFIYYVSLTGVTGARSRLPKDLTSKIRRIKTKTRQPVCVGFGISRPHQVKALAKVADGIIVGSALIKEIQKHQGKKDLTARVARFVKKLASPLR